MSVRLAIDSTAIAGVHVVTRKPIGDDRGHFERLFCADELGQLMAGKSIAQINRTWTANRGTVRGLHFQHPPHAETKLITCLEGEIFDVAVDLRRDSPTWLQWHAELLSADNHRAMMIPEGIAHGFQALRDGCELLYLHTSFYRPDAEGGLHTEDPRLSIDWPLPVEGLSPRDMALPFVGDDFTGLNP